ncbi:hypothetical protein SY83_05235 [Paenibacillus swuensis]|uniref:Chemotaxis protein n=1 Tax=Paenibacillus swuensis TaxID=1178515 RepID=A0A172TFL2_9BACL|nr:HAMP domain-containing methyl-accepting chemotaxis protein [Paenibacillus swuensis]ANE45800.1 hypothetical protein SY83_05235 [Paenibacillus swuensis]
MKIITKMIVSISLLALVLVIYVFVSMNQSNKTEKRYENLIADEEQVRFLVKSIQFRLAGWSNDERAYLLVGESSYKEGIADKRADVEGMLKTLNAMDLPDMDKTVLAKIQGNYNTFLEASGKVLEAYDKKDAALARSTHFGEERSARKELDPILSDYLKKKEAGLSEKSAAIQQSSDVVHLMMQIVAAGVISFAVLIGYLLYRAMKPLQLVGRQLSRIAEGGADLTSEITVKGKDEVSELASSFNQMMRNLRSIVTDAQQTAAYVATSSQALSMNASEMSAATVQIAEATQELASSAETQLTQMSDISSAMDEISESVKSIGHHSGEVAVLSDQTVLTSGTGVELSRNVLLQMGQVYTTVQDTVTAIQGLNERSQEIGSIVSVINEIAGQTNLLALNASIEAARAGDMGRGFAVVASEVRKLAERSALSAAEIEHLVKQVQEETGQVREGMEAGLQTVELGLTQVKQVTSAFEAIDESLQQIAQQVAYISNSMEQTSDSSHRIAGMTAIGVAAAMKGAEITQETAAATEQQYASIDEISSAAKNMTAMAAQLKQLLAEFKV